MNRHLEVVTEVQAVADIRNLKLISSDSSVVREIPSPISGQLVWSTVGQEVGSTE